MTTDLIGVLVLPSSNLKSIMNALNRIEANFILVSEPEQLVVVNKLIIPGVGSYANTMKFLHEKNLVDSILSFASMGNPLLGICLGMQIMMSWGEEGGKVAGLSLISGEVKAFETNNPKFRVPHVGWNNLMINRDSVLFNDIPSSTDFYFTHSYYVEPALDDAVLATTNHGNSFSSVINKKNIYGVQFHPEKSGKHGIQLLRNFVYNA
jgi:imidazole glycerol phosphate synthase glutamine amidotransferase subunit